MMGFISGGELLVWIAINSVQKPDDIVILTFVL